MILSLGIVVLLLILWGTWQRRRFGVGVWRLLIPAARGSAPVAALLAVALQVVSVCLYLGVIRLGASLAGELGAQWLTVAAVVLAGSFHAPVLVMAMPESNTYYAVLRGSMETAGATPEQRRAAAWAGGAAAILSLVFTLAGPFMILLEN